MGLTRIQTRQERWYVTEVHTVVAMVRIQSKVLSQYPSVERTITVPFLRYKGMQILMMGMVSVSGLTEIEMLKALCGSGL